MSTNKPRIIHIISSLGQGGAEAILFRLVQRMENSPIVICLTNEGVYGERLRQVGAKVIILNMPAGKLTFKGLIKLYKTLHAERSSVVQTWMYHADLLGGMSARLLGIKAIVWGLHNSNLDSGKTKQVTRLVAWLCAKISRWVPAKIISCSILAAQKHQKLGYKAERFVIISNGYSLDLFKPDNDARLRLRTQLGFNTTIPVLCMVARFDPLKDHNNLIRALGIVKRNAIDFKCLLVGKDIDNENKELINQLAKEMVVDRVQLLGIRDDIPTVMNASDIHILSSIGEAFPNVLAEAMSCGTPCVSTNVGDASIIIADTGWVVPPEDGNALANVIITAIKLKETDPVAWQNRKNACRQRIVENFSLDKMVTSYQQVWSEVAAKYTK